jgi:starch-binding outer membrane protein, SusD/RagB family
MNKNILTVLVVILLTSCSNWLDVEPLDKIQEEKILNDGRGPVALLATIYRDLPMDEFNFNPFRAGGLQIFEHGYNYRGNSAGTFMGGFSASFMTDDALNPNGPSFFDGMAPYWTYAYQSIRRVNQVIDAISKSSVSEADKKTYLAEAKFINAYIYFQLARRYGGVPLISNVQNIGDNLEIPRSTEKLTYDYVLAQCDLAIADLPAVAQAKGRANKWAALALKSRVALHAASICKYQSKVAFDPSYSAVAAKLAGAMVASDANSYYQICIDASKAIIDQSGKALYMPNPSSPEAAMKNYSTLFQDPAAADVEIIFAKYYMEGGAGNRTQGHSTDYMYNPRQTNPSNMATKFNPTLDLVDVYESYSNDGIRQDGILQTRNDGVETSDYGYADSKRSKYIRYNNPQEIFANKDARFFASIIGPGTVWKGKSIIIQGGLIRKNGSSRILLEANETHNGVTYYTFGAADQSLYSGFANITSGNHTQTGFSIRKFLQEDKNVILTEGLHSTTPFIDMRLAEIYLNYAEAVVESGLGDAALAGTYLNAIRKRAGHQDNVDASIINIMKERRVELAFEGSFRFWDLIRRREFQEVFPVERRRRLALLPIIDLSGAAPTYIMARATSKRDDAISFWEPRYYYQSIPGIAQATYIIQNPQY